MKYNSLCSYLILFFPLQLQALNDNPKMQQNASLSQPIKTFELKANCTHLIVLRDEVADVTPAVPANAVQAPKMVKNPASVIKISVCDSVSVPHNTLTHIHAYQETLESWTYIKYVIIHFTYRIVFSVRGNVVLYVDKMARGYGTRALGRTGSYN